ncbi:hypothetical protein FRC11_012069, partial [Ceratobasidium sp. 423]
MIVNAIHLDSRTSLSTTGRHSEHTSPPTSSYVQRTGDPHTKTGINDASEGSDADTEMVDACLHFDTSSNLGQDPNDRVQSQDPAPDDLKNIPNLFRLLDLVDEHGSGGIVEKVVIDQSSLHRVLNIVQPGSYDSVSKINFKALDSLSIKPTGVYGNRSEIISFLWEAQYLDENSVALLSRASDPDDATTGLRSGLYLVLDPNHASLGLSKSAYIVYWPEATTWDDQAASSSVRRNRVTFIRYLTKLADQIVALVSPPQAEAFVWDTSAHNKDLPEDQQENNDDSRLFSFEVSKSLEQEEDAVGSAGFMVPVESRLLPRDEESSRVRLVPGEHKLALLTVRYERPQPQEKHFEENINAFIEQRVIQDKPKVKDEIRMAVRVIHDKIYPSLKFTFDVAHEPGVSAELHRRYAGLRKLEGEIRKKHKLDQIQDQEYQDLKSQWLLVEDYFVNNPALSRGEQDKFVNDVLNGTAAGVLTFNGQPSGGFGGFIASGVSTVRGFFGRGNSRQDSRLNLRSGARTNTSRQVPDPDFVAHIHSMRDSYPALSELLRRIQTRLWQNLEVVEKKILDDQLNRIVSGERHRQSVSANEARDTTFKQGKEQSFERLMVELKQAMPSNAPKLRHVDWEDLKLSIYIFDELFTNLRSRGSPIPLKDWYNRPVDIERACFVSGLEEVCLIETSGRVRVFSLITQQFRNAFLQIDRPIVDAFSAPDGSCLLVAVASAETPTQHQVLAFHWASFGTNKRGINSAGLLPCDGYAATRFEGRGRVHVVSFSGGTRTINSTVLKITQKATEFSFRSDREQPRKTAAETVNNSLIDCHLEVWTRFPVFLGLRILIAVYATFSLAVTRENRFIPLKDGVWDPDYERSLLGADVPAIIDALSLGWYESLFQSYMAKKPVRVVSSMGEQSVGKSYCLNHFADTSFAGSAMRTTEGVWLSCTPTEKYLLVSLDFEGVHSIERSAQEDALLVLFNTAISNLVLFRNNFAMSRDIAGLFTSFQSSATVLDPNVNRGLFNSTLAIIIKDVTNADSKDIVKEFSLKFQAIVEKERDQNFITRLHRGRIQIIPWPVINSPGFYTLFNRLHQRLDQQPFTHGSGGAFLHNLKTLMAKIKVHNTVPNRKNLAAHRAQQMMERLPNALCYGREDEGPLKNMDTDEELPTPSHMPPLFVPEFSGANTAENEVLAEQALRSLIHTCGPAMHTRYQMPDASYVEALQTRLYEILDQRLSLVQQWVSVNIERFPSGNQDIRNLTGKLNTASLAMRTAVQLCSSVCSD